MRPQWKWKSPVVAGPPMLVYLSVRESDVLECLCRGMGTEKIAEQLHIKMNTLKRYEQVLRDKLRANSRHDIVSAVLTKRVQVVVRGPQEAK